MSLYELSAELRLFNSALHKALRNEMSQLNSYSMTELEALLYLFKNKKVLPTDLAVITRISTPSISQILKKIEGQGIIERTPSIEDKRKVYVSLTSTGRKLVENIKYSKDEYLKDLIQTKLSAKEVAFLVKVMPILEKLIS